MTQARAIVAAFVAAFLLLGLGCATPEALKPTRAWDQSAVTSLAGELADRVHEAAATAGNENVESYQAESVNNYLNDLSILERQCRHLHSELKEGKNLSQTSWIYDEVKRFYQTVYQTGSWQIIEDKFGAGQTSTAALIEQLDAYYGKNY